MTRHASASGNKNRPDDPPRLGVWKPPGLRRSQCLPTAEASRHPDAAAHRPEHRSVVVVSDGIVTSRRRKSKRALLRPPVIAPCGLCRTGTVLPAPSFRRKRPARPKGFGGRDRLVRFPPAGFQQWEETGEVKVYRTNRSGGDGGMEERGGRGKMVALARQEATAGWFFRAELAMTRWFFRAELAMTR
jgi:hypothetical protein